MEKNWGDTPSATLISLLLVCLLYGFFFAFKTLQNEVREFRINNYSIIK